MKKKPEIPKIPIKPFPFFKKGQLIFLDSGHKLTESDGYYRCTLDTNHKCNVGEDQAKKINLERNFANLSMKFAITGDDTDRVRNTFMREVLCDMIIDVTEKDNRNDEVIDATHDAALADLIAGKPLSKSDIKDFKDEFQKQQANEFPLVLVGYIGEALSAFYNAESNKGRFLSFLAKHIYLVNNGKIVQLEMERWGWYILNYIDRYIPNYLETLKRNGVKIINDERDGLIPLHLKEAAHFFDDGKQSEALSNYQPAIMVEILTFLKSSISVLTMKDPNAVQIATLAMFKGMTTNPAFQALKPLMPMLNVKKPKRGNKAKI